MAEIQLPRSITLYLGRQWPAKEDLPAREKWGLISFVKHYQHPKEGQMDVWALHLLPLMHNWFNFEWEPSGYECIQTYSLGILGCYTHL